MDALLFGLGIFIVVLIIRYHFHFMSWIADKIYSVIVFFIKKFKKSERKP